jgi:hypothetical protein
MSEVKLPGKVKQENPQIGYEAGESKCGKCQIMYKRSRAHILCLPSDSLNKMK